MSVSNELLSSTLHAIRDEEVDALFKKVAFLDNAKRAGGIDYESGGTQLYRPIVTTNHSSITQYTTGWEAFSLAGSDVMRAAIYDWCDFSAPIIITQKEELENSGERAIIKILEARMKNVMAMLKREANKQILAGSSTTLTLLNSLNGVPSANTTYFLEDAAAASQTNVVGGLGKSVLGVAGWQNQWVDGGNDFSANGLNGMHTLWARANAVAPKGTISCVIASIAGFTNYKASLQQLERYVDLKSLDGGRLVLSYNGVPVEQDAEMPTNTGVGTDEVSMYFLNFEDGIKLIIHEDADFAIDDFVTVPGTSARTAKIYTKMQLVADHLGSQGVLTKGDTL